VEFIVILPLASDLTVVDPVPEILNCDLRVLSSKSFKYGLVAAALD
jgi:hypothetical protein